MKKIILGCLLMSLSQLAWAEPRRILLNDGTEIIGEVLSFQNGSYTIRSKTLGTLKLSDRQVQQISSVGHTAVGQNPLQTGQTALQSSQVQSIQQRLAGDGAMVQRILALQSSPEMQAVLSDPEVMAAIQSLDFETLANHPKIKRLMSNQSVKAITRETN